MKVLNIILVLFLPIVFIVSIPTRADVCFFGYQANTVTAINEIYDDYGLTPNVGVVYGKDFKVFRQSAEALNKHGAKAIIVIGDLIFEKVKTSLLDCSDYQNVIGSEDEVGLRLYSDWKQRLSTFLVSEKDYLNSGNVMILGISDEVNTLCVPTSDIDEVAKFIKGFGINPPIGVAYALTELGEDLGRARPLPDSFPENIDVIAFYDYGIFDPNDSENPLNASRDWTERWNNFKSKLGTRKAILVLNAFCNRAHVQLGWVQNCTPEYVKPLTISSYRWRDWALSEPEVIGILGFNWLSWNNPPMVGTRDMHKVVQNSHQNIINAINCDYK